MKHKIYDVIFIGSGISTSFSIINLLDRIEKSKPKRKITLGIVEKYNEFNTGIPYGSRSGYSTLLITSLKDFLIDSERFKFMEWLNKNKESLLSEFKSEGGILSEKWIKTHEEQIKNNDWENLYIPRRFFGCYIDEQVNNRIKKLSDKNVIDVEFINGEVIDLHKLPSHFELKLANGTVLLTQKAVLSIGSLPTIQIYKTKDLFEEENIMLINSAYHPELRTNLNKAISFLNKRQSKETNILIIGANASALELLYKLNDTINTQNPNFHFSFLSSQGLLPDAPKETKKQGFIPENLKKLSKETTITSEAIADAAFKDLDLAESKNLGAAFTVNIISKQINELLKRLTVEELEKFACFHGNQIGRRQRCAGKHYIDTINILSQENRFTHIAGRFVDIVKNNNCYSLKYLETATAKEKISKNPYHLIINCMGSINLENGNLPILLKNTMEKGLVEANDSKIGFRVNQALEASKNLHIMGPLLAGNVIENNAVWHVEHCGRIIWLSKILAKEIYNTLNV